ncbi:MAG: hypothetical protein RI909_1480 [Bacteroidota bacterium]|jgi:hypothetical protein
MKYFLALILFFLCSCAPKLSNQLRSFEKLEPTISQWKDLPVQPLTFESETKVNLDETCPVHLFPSGKSYVQGFALPAKQPLEVIIKSYPIGNSIHDAYLFVPCVLLLDENFHVIHTLEQTDSLIERTPLFETPYVAFKNTFTFTIWPAHRVSYFVVYTTDKQRNQVSTIKMMTYSQVILPGFVGAVPVGKRVLSVPHAPVGLLKISVKDLK